MANTSINPFGAGGELPAGYPIVNDLVTDNAQAALSAAMGKELQDEIDDIVDDINTSGGSGDDGELNEIDGKQAYGDIGSSIQFATLSGCSYTYIKRADGCVVTFKTHATADVGSYIQYIGRNGKVTSREVIRGTYSPDTEYSVPLNFGIDDVGVYISYKTGTLTTAVYPVLDRMSSLHRRFVDFGTMPSCIDGETGCFLGDKIDGTFTPTQNAAGKPENPVSMPDAYIKYADLIDKYDALVTAYPNYVAKHSFGKDGSDTIDMYYYTFTPKYYTQHVYLQAGVHGWEPGAVFALAEIMYLIANAYGGNLSPKVLDSPELMLLRGAVKFTVVPCANPWGFNRRSDCKNDTAGVYRTVASNAYGGSVQGSYNGDSVIEAVYIRNLVTSIAHELSFSIDMHTTVGTGTRNYYGCFYGLVNKDAENVRTVYRTYEWLYEFYDVKYPSIVNGDTCPNPLGGGFASVGYRTQCFHDWCYGKFGVQSSTMEFSEHVWSSGSQDESSDGSISSIAGSGNVPKIQTSTAMSVAVNMYLNQILQQVYDCYKVVDKTTIPQSDYYQARG